MTSALRALLAAVLVASAFAFDPDSPAPMAASAPTNILAMQTVRTKTVRIAAPSRGPAVSHPGASSRIVAETPVDGLVHPGPGTRRVLVFVGSLAMLVRRVYEQILDEAGIDLDPRRKRLVSIDSDPHDTGESNSDGPGGPDIRLEPVDVRSFQEGGRTKHRNLARMADIDRVPPGTYVEARQFPPVGMIYWWAHFKKILERFVAVRDEMADADASASPDEPGRRFFVLTIVAGCGGTAGMVIALARQLNRIFSRMNFVIQLVLLEPLDTPQDARMVPNGYQRLLEIVQDFALGREGRSHPVFMPEGPPVDVPKTFDHVILVQNINADGAGGRGPEGLAKRAASLLAAMTATPLGYTLDRTKIQRPDGQEADLTGVAAEAPFSGVGVARIRYDARGIHRRVSWRQIAHGARVLIGEGHAGDKDAFIRGVEREVLVAQQWLEDRLEFAPAQRWKVMSEDKGAFVAGARSGGDRFLTEARAQYAISHEQAVAVRQEVAARTLRALLERFRPGGNPLGLCLAAAAAIAARVDEERDAARPFEARIEIARAERDQALRTLERAGKLRRSFGFRRKAGAVQEATNDVASLERAVVVGRLYEAIVLDGARDGVVAASKELRGARSAVDGLVVVATSQSRPEVSSDGNRIVPKDPGLVLINTLRDDDAAYEDHAVTADADAAALVLAAIADTLGAEWTRVRTEDLVAPAFHGVAGRFATVLTARLVDKLPADETEKRQLLENLYKRAEPWIKVNRAISNPRRITLYGLPKECADLEKLAVEPTRTEQLDDPYELICLRAYHDITLQGLADEPVWQHRHREFLAAEGGGLATMQHWWRGDEDRTTTLLRAVIVGVIRPEPSSKRFWYEYRPRGAERESWIRLGKCADSWVDLLERARDDGFMARVESALTEVEGVLGGPALVRQVESTLLNLEKEFPEQAWAQLRDCAIAWMDGDLAAAFRHRGGPDDGTAEDDQGDGDQQPATNGGRAAQPEHGDDEPDGGGEGPETKLVG